MDKALAGFLDGLHREGRRHDAPLADRLLRMRNMTPEAAGLIAQLIRAQGGGQVLEIGTSNGYSAIWFADAARDTGGHLVTAEVDGERVAAARRNLAAAGVAAYATVEHADGGEVLRRRADASVDVAVLDAERPAYAGYWPEVRRVLRRHGVLAVDNAISHRGQVAPFHDLLAADEAFAVQVLALGDGVLTAVRIR